MTAPSRRAWLLGGCVALTIAGQVVGECFPLSPWPMYEAPGLHRGVIVVVDGDGRPVSLAGTGWSAARLQKRLIATATRGDPDPVASVRAALLADAARAGHSLPVGLRLGWLAIDVVEEQGELRVTERLGPLEDAP